MGVFRLLLLLGCVAAPALGGTILRANGVAKKEAVANCANGAQKTVDCNDCFCFGGDWACTMRLCPEMKSEVS